MQPRLFTFDIFGTVLDWKRGLTEALAAAGRPISDREFDAIIDAQGRDEEAGFRPYCEITERSLLQVLDLPPVAAKKIGTELGRWPLFADSSDGLRALMSVAPCAATTNSDRQHGIDVQASLGFPLSHWFCAEELRLYKPAPDFWRQVSQRLVIPLDRAWWHVSAYADYDLEVAQKLGLTTVFVRRPHNRPAAAHVVIDDLLELAEKL
jgi:2-haloacid dehalogenase